MVLNMLFSYYFHTNRFVLCEFGVGVCAYMGALTERVSFIAQNKAFLEWLTKGLRHMQAHAHIHTYK